MSEYSTIVTAASAGPWVGAPSSRIMARRCSAKLRPRSHARPDEEKRAVPGGDEGRDLVGAVAGLVLDLQAPERAPVDRGVEGDLEPAPQEAPEELAERVEVGLAEDRLRRLQARLVDEDVADEGRLPGVVGEDEGLVVGPLVGGELLRGAVEPPARDLHGVEGVERQLAGAPREEALEPAEQRLGPRVGALRGGGGRVGRLRLRRGGRADGAGDWAGFSAAGACGAPPARHARTVAAARSARERWWFIGRTSLLFRAGRMLPGRPAGSGRSRATS